MFAGERLRSLRKEKKMTMKELGSRLKLAESTISGYETGSREPDLDVVNKLADMFEVSTDYLLGRSVARTPEHGMAFSGGGKDWTEEEIRMAEAIAIATIENMRKQQGK